VKTAIGIALVAAQAAAFVALARPGTDLQVELAAPTSIEGRVSLARAVETTDAGPLAHRRWTVTYRGGYTRAVGATALVGPFQDPAAPPCGGRVVVGEALLEQLAAPLGTMLDAELRGTHVPAAGDYVRVDHVALAFASDRAFERSFVGDAPHGYIRATADIVFARVTVPIIVALVPERSGTFRVGAHAGFDLDNRVLDWINDELGGDKLATRLARRQIDGALATTLAPPPPFSLGDGQELAFTYCDGDVDIVDGEYGALPFAVVIHGRDVALVPGTLPAPHATSLALDLAPNALDALLAELWRSGWLDRRLTEVGLDRKFAEDPTVAQFLSVRISPPHLALPPVITASAGGLRLAADARVTIHDGDTATTGRIYGALDFTFAEPARAVAIDVGALELACERTPTTLVPCYADLVDALRERGPEFHGALTDAFGKIVGDIFVERRLGDGRLPADLAIRRARPALAGGTLHLELDAAVVTK